MLSTDPVDKTVGNAAARPASRGAKRVADALPVQ
jgi:hypothetical protein